MGRAWLSMMALKKSTHSGQRSTRFESGGIPVWIPGACRVAGSPTIIVRLYRRTAVPSRAFPNTWHGKKESFLPQLHERPLLCAPVFDPDAQHNGIDRLFSRCIDIISCACKYVYWYQSSNWFGPMHIDIDIIVYDNKLIPGGLLSGCRSCEYGMLLSISI